jgi:hypothetical protein
MMAFRLLALATISAPEEAPTATSVKESSLFLLSSLYVDPGRRCPRVGTVRRGGTSRDCATYALGLSDPSVNWISISSRTSGGIRQKPRAPLQGMGSGRDWGFLSTKP